MDLSLPHPPDRPVFYRRLADVVLVLGLAASVYGWQQSADALRAEQDRHFDALASEKVARIVESLERYMDLAGSLAALFEASSDVSRREFHEHFRSLRALDRYPALQAAQYAPRVAAVDRERFEAAVRADTSLQAQGYPGFRIHPPGERDEYFPVLYNEPMEGNEAAFGDDHAA
jgi:CHASE1-domain containing sensor protein